MFKPEFPTELSMVRFGVTTFPIDCGLPVVDLARAVEEGTGVGRAKDLRMACESLRAVRLMIL